MTGWVSRFATIYFAKAIVLEYEDSQMALVSLDLINVTEELTTPAKEFISQEVGIPAENVLICATHTHTGPEVRHSGVVGRSEEWVAGLATVDLQILSKLRQIQPFPLRSGAGA